MEGTLNTQREFSGTPRSLYAPPIGKEKVLSLGVPQTPTLRDLPIDQREIGYSCVRGDWG